MGGTRGPSKSLAKPWRSQADVGMGILLQPESLTPAEVEAAAPQEESGSPLSWLLPSPVLVAFMRHFMLFAACATSFLIAALGVTILTYLFVARTYTPSTAHMARTLYFDYTRPEAVAVVPILQAEDLMTGIIPKGGIPGNARFASPGQRMDVWVEMELPESQVNRDIFQLLWMQLTGELLTLDGRLAGKASRPCLAKYRSSLARYVRTIALAPLAMLGLWDERQILRVELFTNYREKADLPFAIFRATLQGRAGGGLPPQLYGAEVHVRLRLGVIRRLLYWARPGYLSTLVLAPLALTAVAGGGVSTFVFLVLWIVSSSSSSPKHKDGSKDEDEHEVSSVSGLTDASTGMLSESEGGSDVEEAEYESWHKVAPPGLSPRPSSQLSVFSEVTSPYTPATSHLGEEGTASGPATHGWNKDPGPLHRRGSKRFKVSAYKA